MHKDSSRQLVVRPTLVSTASRLLSYFLFLTVLFLAPEARAGAPALVQVNSAVSSGESSISIVYLNTQTAGNLNVVMVMWGDTSSTVTSVKDSKNNSYVLAIGPTRGTGLTSSIYYAANIAAGSNTVTVKFNQTAAFPNVNVAEFSGVATTSPLDVTAGASGPGTTAPNSGSATTHSANELIIGAANGQYSFTGLGTHFSQAVTNTYGGLSEYEISTGPGSYNATATQGQSGNWVMQMATFKPPSPCAYTSYGDGVTCVQGAGNQAGKDVNTVIVSFTPKAAGDAVIAAGYTCWNVGITTCTETGTTTLSIGDNVNNPDTCFVASPHSPFTLIETSPGQEHIQMYIWICPRIPSGVTQLTMTCSASGGCSWMTLLVTEWTGLSTSADPFDVDGGAASTVQWVTGTVSTSSATNYTNELMFTFWDTTFDQWDCAVAPYQAPEECCNTTGGNINTAVTTGSTKGTQTAQITWNDPNRNTGSCPNGGNTTTDWYGVIVGIKSLNSQ